MISHGRSSRVVDCDEQSECEDEVANTTSLRMVLDDEVGDGVGGEEEDFFDRADGEPDDVVFFAAPLEFKIAWDAADFDRVGGREVLEHALVGHAMGECNRLARSKT